MKNLLLAACLALPAATALNLGTPAVHAEEAKAVELGQVVPDFTLPVLGGEGDWRLSDQSGKIVVVVFHSIKCPWYRMRADGGYDRVLNKLAPEWVEKEVVLVGINSNHNDSREDIAAYLKKHDIAYPVLKDNGSEVADLLGGKTTPHFFVIDTEGKLVYRGGFEAVPASPKVCGDSEEKYLVPVIDELLDGDDAPLPYTDTASKGCGIKR